MTYLEDAITMLHADPKTLAGVPCDEQIIASNADLTKFGVTSLTEGERQGFLEMWRFDTVKRTVEQLDDADLETLRETATRELRALTETERRIGDLRFLAGAAQHALATRTKQISEESK